MVPGSLDELILIAEKIAFKQSKGYVLSGAEPLLSATSSPTSVWLTVQGFLQEEAGSQYAELIIKFINGNPEGFTMEKKVIDRNDIL